MTGSGVVGEPRRSPDRVSDAVVDAVADAESTDPTALPPLYAAVEPDSLNRLVPSENERSMRVSFEYAGYDVVVTGAGDVTVSAIDD